MVTRGAYFHLFEREREREEEAMEEYKCTQANKHISRNEIGVLSFCFLLSN